MGPLALTSDPKLALSISNQSEVVFNELASSDLPA